MRFLKIETQMFPAERIESINRQANIGGEMGIEVKLYGVRETFQYTGQYASLAWDVLNGIDPAPAAPPSVPSLVILAQQDGVVVPVEAVTIQGQTYRFVVLDGETINADNIEWVDFNAPINGTNGVELRLATDAPGVTRTYVLQQASEAYDALVLLAEEIAATA